MTKRKSKRSFIRESTSKPSSTIHETEIKMVKSKWSYKKFMVEIRNRNELRGSKRIIKLETNYEDRNELRNYVSIREIISYLLNIIYTHYKLKKTKKRKLMDYSSKFASINASMSKFLSP